MLPSDKFHAVAQLGSRGDFVLTILLVIVLLMLVGAFPAWPYSRGWGYYPSGGLTIVLVILLVMLLMR
jgi:hypothetical protein